ncbi:hypothetical protein ACTXT7_008165 [Hymenolepis weldensis]
MMALDFDPLFRLKKRLDSLRRTHDAGVARSAFLTERNYNTNRQLMESLIHRLHSVDSKAKRTKRVMNRVKLSSPKKMRPLTGKQQELFNPSYSDYADFHNKLNPLKRMHPSEYCENSDSNLLKDLKDLPALHPSQVSTVLRKKGMGSGNASQKGEPIFPPPPDPSCSLSARPVVSSGTKSTTSNAQRIRKGSQSFNQAGPSVPSTSCMNSYTQNMRPGMSTSLAADSYPYADLRTKYDPDFYQSQSTCYDQLALPGFSNYYGFNYYAHSSGHGNWPSLGKYEQSMSGRLTQPSSTSLSPPDITAGYRANYPVTTGPENPPGFTTNLPFNQSFQSDNFMQSMQSYPPLDSQQPTYGMNLPSYSYPPPPNTTSYM